MRANPGEFDLVTPGSLHAVVSLLAAEPGAWLPIAGGTDLMVLYSAGKLPARKLVNIWNIPELRGIEILPAEIHIGAACTYTDLRRNDIISREFPLLASAAAWTGGIANQNRGTLGGNIVNASPAADSLPALLVYDATLVLVSARGEREVSYTAFHQGYKKHLLAPDELIRTIHLPRNFASYIPYSRKVGARRAQAISKVCIAALANVRDGVIQDARVALGSVAPVPLRLTDTERLLIGQKLDPQLAPAAARTVAAQILPIDDIRSTIRYRTAVAANMVAEFVEALQSQAAEKRNEVLARWNDSSPTEAAEELLPCCGSPPWAKQLASRKPFPDAASLLAASDEVWLSLPASAWLQAFHSHPRIGGASANVPVAARSSVWSQQEQLQAAAAPDAAKQQLAEANRAYEQKFGHIFIVCATGKSAAEILEILRRRMHNDAVTELREAAEQQGQITQLRLKKWLGL